MVVRSASRAAPTGDLKLEASTVQPKARATRCGGQGWGRGTKLRSKAKPFQRVGITAGRAVNRRPKPPVAGGGGVAARAQPKKVQRQLSQKPFGTEGRKH